MPDSSKFRDKSKVNIQSSVKSETFHAHGVRLGAFEIGIDQLEKTFGKTKFNKLFESSEFIPPHDHQG